MAPPEWLVIHSWIVASRYPNSVAPRIVVLIWSATILALVNSIVVGRMATTRGYFFSVAARLGVGVGFDRVTADSRTWPEDQYNLSSTCLSP